jgi:hypothetical protein
VHEQSFHIHAWPVMLQPCKPVTQASTARMAHSDQRCHSTHIADSRINRPSPSLCVQMRFACPPPFPKHTVLGQHGTRLSCLSIHLSVPPFPVTRSVLGQTWRSSVLACSAPTNASGMLMPLRAIQSISRSQRSHVHLSELATCNNSSKKHLNVVLSRAPMSTCKKRHIATIFQEIFWRCPSRDPTSTYL